MQLVFALATLITDESVRLRVLEAIFPKMHVTATPTRSIDRPLPKVADDPFYFDDALRGEMVYRVTGFAKSWEDQCNASDVLLLPGQERPSMVRELRMRAFAYAPTRAVADVHLKYVGANPPMSCPAITRAHSLESSGGQWRLTGSVTFDTVHHWGVESIRFLDLTGDGIDEFVVESDGGGAQTFLSAYHVFDLKESKLKLRSTALAIVVSTLDGDQFVQHFDVPRSRESGGKRICFTKTTYMVEGKKLSKPRITYPCYKLN